MSETWQPLGSEELLAELESAIGRMNDQQSRLWDKIRIKPQKWQLSPWGDQGSGFWAVGLLGNSVIWYNDIEEGFNRSPFTQWGEIDLYLAGQDQLEWLLAQLLDEINLGAEPLKQRGVPQPLEIKE